MTRTRRFLGGVAFGYLSLGVTTVAGLWLTPFILHRLGQHDYGLWLVTAQVLGYLALLDLGVVALLPRETAYLTGRGQGAPLGVSVPPLVARTAVIVLLQAPMVAAAALLVVLALPAAWAPLRWPLALVLGAFVACFPLRLFAALLQGLQDLSFLGKVQLGSWLGGTAVTVALLLAGARLYAVAIGAIVTQLATVVAAWIRVRLRYRETLPRRPALGDRAAARRQFASGIWVSVSQIAQVLLYGTDLVIVARLFGPAAVVPYSCTGKLVTVLMNQPQILTATAAPALSELKAIGDRGHLREVSGTLALATMVLSGAVFAAVLTINRGFVAWWVGDRQYSGDVLTLLFLVNMLLRHFNVALTYTLFAFGYERRLSIVALADGLVTVGSGLALARVLGPAGAVAGSIAGVTLVSTQANLRALARELGVPVRGTVAPLWPWAWRFAAVAAACALFLVRIPVAPRFLPLALAGTVALAAYALVLLPVMVRGPLGTYTRPLLAGLRERAGAAVRARRPRRVAGTPGRDVDLT
jgi:O-antigen/teichoic acid export membrane protein